MAEQRNRSRAEDEGAIAVRHGPEPGLLTVLPCADATVGSNYFDRIARATGVELLPVALASTLAYRAQQDEPDVIVMATEDFGAAVWRHSDALEEALLHTPSLLLAGNTSAAVKRRAARMHVVSVLPLEVSAEQMLAALRATAAGLAVSLPPAEEERGWTEEEINDGDEFTVENLTVRETEVLRLMALGDGNKEIAARLGISGHTAKFHVSSVLAKLGAASRTEAVTLGILRGLVAI